jgi:hypothetical protein
MTAVGYQGDAPSAQVHGMVMVRVPVMRAMCNPYSKTKGRDAIRPPPGIFPDPPAPVIRNCARADGERWEPAT